MAKACNVCKYLLFCIQSAVNMEVGFYIAKYAVITAFHLYFLRHGGTMIQIKICFEVLKTFVDVFPQA